MFARTQYRHAIASGISRMISRLEKSRIPAEPCPYGHEIQDLRDGLMRAAGLRLMEK